MNRTERLAYLEEREVGLREKLIGLPPCPRAFVRDELEAILEERDRLEWGRGASSCGEQLRGGGMDRWEERANKFLWDYLALAYNEFARGGLVKLLIEVFNEGRQQGQAEAQRPLTNDEQRERLEVQVLEE